MNEYLNELSNLSYTNKDFNTIYPELLQLAANISYKWDPSQSDESDPGVVLLKLAALMADKNNYNIDKNILEAFPLSVTQLNNARQLYEQCGYSMKYYQAATSELSITLHNPPPFNTNTSAISEEDEWNEAVKSYTIPQFTMFSDTDNSIVYTTTEAKSVTSKKETILVPIIQGTINQYSINGKVDITPTDLDYNNRLYFNEVDVAENGIFIKPIEDKEWVRVDNLYIQPLGTYCYKFGIENNSGQCYIEFPSDVNSLISESITIHYIRTKGSQGNLGKNRITQLFSELPIYETAIYNRTTYEADKPTTLTTDNLSIINKSIIKNGADPETIDEAFKAYQRVKNTFNNLVTPTDYTNYLITNNVMSNGVITDNTNDPNFTYEIKDANGINHIYDNILIYKEGVGAADSDDPETHTLDSFELVWYGLTYVPNPATTTEYAQSFTLINLTNTDDTQNSVFQTLERTLQQTLYNAKCLNHSFKSLPENQILFIKNKFPIISKIIPYVKLTNVEQNEVLNNIRTALYKALNSQQLTLGEEISYDLIYDTIISADPRIKAITLEDLTYKTYVTYIPDGAVILENHQLPIYEVRIDSNYSDTDVNASGYSDIIKSFREWISLKSVMKGVTPLYIQDNTYTNEVGQEKIYQITDVESISTEVAINMSSSETSIQNNTATWTLTNIPENINIRISSPSMIQVAEHSSYQKFIWTGSDITANTEHEISGNEVLYIFWKTSSDDTNYKYAKYTASSSNKYIIPSFKLSKNSDGISNLSSLSNDTGEILDDTLNQAITELSGNDYVLSGTNTISVYKVNEVNILDTSNDIYWILNTTAADGSQYLFKAGETEYTLKEGESFFYTNPTRTSLNILGAGTKISREGEGTLSAWSCKAVDYDDILEQGPLFLDYNNGWFKINSEISSLTATEHEFYDVGAGASISLTGPNPIADNTNWNELIIYSSEYSGTKSKDINNSDIAITNITIKSFDTEILLPNKDWTFDTQYNIKCSNDMSQILVLADTSIVRAATIKFYQHPKSTPHCIHISNPPIQKSSTTNLPLAKSLLIYQDGTTTTPDSHAGNYLWFNPSNITGTMIINSECTLNNYIQANHIYYSPSIWNVSGSTCNQYTISLKCNKEFELRGGTNVNVSYLSSDLSKTLYPTFTLYATQEIGFNTNQTITKTKIGNTVTYSNTSSTAESITIPLNVISNGDYIIQTDQPITIDTINTINQNITLIYSNETNNKYYYKYTTSTTSSLTYIIPKESSITISNPIQVEFNDKLLLGTSTNEAEFKTKLDSYLNLDSDLVFNPIFQPSEEELILDPLESKSFFDKNHPYNLMTIGMWDLSENSNTSLSVSNAIKYK